MGGRRSADAGRGGGFGAGDFAVTWRIRIDGAVEGRHGQCTAGCSTGAQERGWAPDWWETAETLLEELDW